MESLPVRLLSQSFSVQEGGVFGLFALDHYNFEFSFIGQHFELPKGRRIVHNIIILPRLKQFL